MKSSSRHTSTRVKLRHWFRWSLFEFRLSNAGRLVTCFRNPLIWRSPIKKSHTGSDHLVIWKTVFKEWSANSAQLFVGESSRISTIAAPFGWTYICWGLFFLHKSEIFSKPSLKTFFFLNTICDFYGGFWVRTDFWNTRYNINGWIRTGKQFTCGLNADK